MIEAIYNEKQHFSGLMAKLKNTPIPLESKKCITDFLQGLSDNRITVHRQYFYLSHLRQVAIWMQKSFFNPTREDIETIVRKIDGNEKWQEWTKISYKTSIKRFYKWHLSNDEQYPPCVSWLRINKREVNRKKPEEILTPSEIQNLISAATNARDRALVSILADSGCRIGEILGLLQKDVKFDDYGMLIMVSGKTGVRPVRIIGNSIAHVADWLDKHPSKGRDKPLFVGLDKNTEKRMMNYAQCRKVLAVLTKKAKIAKRVHAHLFRHGKASELASKVPESLLEAHMGWTSGSEMSRVYVHLSGKDVDNAILKAYGIKIKEDELKPVKIPSKCPRCLTINSIDSKFCRQCGMPQTESAIEQYDKVVKKEQDNLAKLLQDPEVIDIITKKIKEQKGRASPPL